MQFLQRRRILRTLMTPNVHLLQLLGEPANAYHAAPGKIDPLVFREEPDSQFRRYELSLTVRDSLSWSLPSGSSAFQGIYSL